LWPGTLAFGRWLEGCTQGLTQGLGVGVGQMRRLNTCSACATPHDMRLTHIELDIEYNRYKENYPIVKYIKYSGGCTGSGVDSYIFASTRHCVGAKFIA